MLWGSGRGVLLLSPNEELSETSVAGQARVLQKEDEGVASAAGGIACPADVHQESSGQTGTQRYAGMGCVLYVKATLNNPIMTFFLHSDNMGQYGEATNYTIWRTTNQINSTITIYF